MSMLYFILFSFLIYIESTRYFNDKLISIVTLYSSETIILTTTTSSTNKKESILSIRVGLNYYIYIYCLYVWNISSNNIYYIYVCVLLLVCTYHCIANNITVRRRNGSYG